MSGFHFTSSKFAKKRKVQSPLYMCSLATACCRAVGQLPFYTRVFFSRFFACCTSSISIKTKGSLCLPFKGNGRAHFRSTSVPLFIFSKSTDFIAIQDVFRAQDLRRPSGTTAIHPAWFRDRDAGQDPKRVRFCRIWENEGDLGVRVWTSDPP